MTANIVCRVMLSLRAPLIETEHQPLKGVPPVFFWDPPAGTGFLPEAYVDITSELELKTEALLKHQSQLAWTLVPLEESTRTIAGFRGLQCGFRYAEGFISHKLHARQPAFALLP
jgi:LmbE family N-acetylglucosaminyl deacetylase